MPATRAATGAVAVSMKRINKRFGAVQANRDVDLRVDAGTVHGVAVWWAPENVEPDDERAAESGLADGPSVVGPVSNAA